MYSNKIPTPATRAREVTTNRDVLESEAGGTRERKIAITQKDLGNIVGVSRESTNKQLRLWEDKKWVRLERNAVVILVIDPIAKIAEGTLGLS
jgi:hypothetical protein